MVIRLLTALFLILLPTLSFGKDYGAVILYDRCQVKFFPDGRKLWREEKAVKITSKRGVKEFGEVVIPFSTEHQRLKLIYAYTVTPDGKVVKPSKKAYNVVYPPFVSEAPIYSDLKYQTISMPAVSPGSVIKYAYEIETFKPYMEGAFWETNYFQDFYPVKEATFTALIPKGVYYKFKTYNMEGKEARPVKSSQGSYVKLSWSLRDVPPLEKERNMPPYGELAKKLSITSIKSWQEVARWYSQLAREALEPDELVRETTLKLIEGKESPEEKLKAIYSFVSKNIRYVGMEFGINGYKPHSAGEVLRNRYGDCKDHATLLVAMLKVAGIKGYPVLIPTLSKANTDPQMPMPTAFNHEIAAVELNGKLLFLDTTSDYVPFGYLPPSDQGRLTLVVDVKEGKGELKETPVFPPSSNREAFKGEFELKPFGTLSGKFSFIFTGVYSVIERARLSEMSQSQVRRHVDELASKVSPGFEVDKFELSDYKELTKEPVELKVEGKDPSYGTLTSHFLLAKFPSPDFSRIVSLVAPRERKYPFVVGYKMEKEVNSTLTLPEGYSLYLKPEDFKFKNRVGSLSLRWQLDGKMLNLSFKMLLNKRIVPPEEYGDLRELFNTAVKSLRNQVVVLKREE
jgi:transglutaminase-like putative cysteine protease